MHLVVGRAVWPAFVIVRGSRIRIISVRRAVQRVNADFPVALLREIDQEAR
jgi:hypothetical protein